jgi:hypothetical protein
MSIPSAVSYMVWWETVVPNLRSIVTTVSATAGAGAVSSSERTVKVHRMGLFHVLLLDRQGLITTPYLHLVYTTAHEVPTVKRKVCRRNRGRSVVRRSPL